VSVSYSVPPTLMRYLHAKGADISVSGRNLAIFYTVYPGLSLESPQGVPNTDGQFIGNPTAPIPKYLIFRISLDN
jgi:hypothetical protein